MRRFSVILSASVLSLAAAAMGQNLLSNPGFENSGTSWTLWVSPASPGAQAAVTYPTTGARTGTRYARVAVASRADENWHIQFQAAANWPVVMGNTYELRFWAKSDSGSPVHVAVQDNDFTYRSGVSYTLTPGEWTEYTVEHVADREGTGAIRFHVYVGEAADVYSFDDFSVTVTATAGVRGGASAQEQGLRVSQTARNFVLSLDAAPGGNWTAQLYDLRGMRIASAAGRADGTLQMALPRDKGTYFIRANAGSKSWVRRVTVL